MLKIDFCLKIDFIGRLRQDLWRPAKSLFVQDDHGRETLLVAGRDW